MTAPVATVLHVDMDAFYASVELARAPWLRGRPVIVGGEGRSVVLAASYEARAYGVHSAMPMARARQLCPGATVVPPDHARYHEVSRGVMDLLRSVTDKVEQISVDEAFLDVSGALKRIGTPLHIAQEIRANVAARYAITCSVGIAVNKSVAKIASTRAKPDGVVHVPPERTVEFLHPLPVTALWGVGDKTAKQLARWGITTIGDLASTDLAAVRRAVGQAAAAHLHELAWGRDPRDVGRSQPEKSLGGEVTFEVDLPPGEQLSHTVRRLADECGTRLRAARKVAGVVAIKVRTPDFVTRNRSRTLSMPTDVGQTIFEIACELLAGLDLNGQRIRLIGVRAEALAPAHEVAVQASFFDKETERRDAERAMDAARARFGSDAVGAASLISPPSTSNSAPADLS